MTTLAHSPQILAGHLARGTMLADGDAGDFRKVNNFARHTHWLHGTAVGYANYGAVLFAALLAGWLVAGPPRAQCPDDCPGTTRPDRDAVLFAVAANQPIVHAVNESRPYTALPHVLLLVHRSVDASFPSDHATMAGAVAAGLLLVSARLGIVATVAALLMAATRVYVGAHYPIDVLVGLAVGAIVATLVSLAATGLVERLVTWALSTRLRPLLTDSPTNAPFAGAPRR